MCICMFNISKRAYVYIWGFRDVLDIWFRSALYSYFSVQHGHEGKVNEQHLLTSCARRDGDILRKKCTILQLSNE